MKLIPEHERKLRRMLAAERKYRKDLWGSRNRYAAEVGSRELETLDAMVDLGLIVEGKKKGGVILYHATEEGCRAVGLSEVRIAEALSRRNGVALVAELSRPTHAMGEE